jgi:hypothetical protein
MGRIQQQFQEGYPGDLSRSYVEEELDKHYTVRTNKDSRVLETPLNKGKGSLNPKNKQSIIIDESPVKDKYRKE